MNQKPDPSTMTPLVRRAEAFLRALLTKAAWWHIVAVMLMIALAAAACAAPVAVPTATPVPIPAAKVVVADSGISAPAELPAGPVTVTISNRRQAPRLLLFARLNAGVTPDQFMAALSTDQTGMAALALVSLLGGREVIPGASKSVIFDLKPGNYVVLDLAAAPPQIAWFTVAAGSGAAPAAPEAAVNVELVDFQFTMPDQIKAGAQTWQIENKGTRLNSMWVLKLNEGATVQDALDIIIGQRVPPDPSPYRLMALWTPMSAGERVWLTVDLPVGAYSVVCILLDFATDPPKLHEEHGMVHTLMVTE